MLIYEITSRRLNEAGLVGSIASSLANKFVSSTLGIDAKAGVTDPNAQQAAALEINQQLARQLGEQLNQVWAQTVQNFIAGHKDTSGNALTKVTDASPADQDQLRMELDKIILKMTGIKEPSLDAWEAAIDTGDDKDKQLAADIGDQIKALESLIWGNLLRDVSIDEQKQTFAKLGVEISRAQTLNTFTSKAAKTGAPTGPKVVQDPKTMAITVDGKPYDPANPVHAQAVKAALGGTP